MADEQIKRKIRNALKSAYFTSENDLVDVSDGDADDTIHLVIVSHKFDEIRTQEKNDLIWSVLVQNLKPEEWNMISLSIATSPTEIKAMG